MKKICSFVINNRTYTIFDVKKIEGKKTYVGQTNYETREIFIENGKEKIITLKHELMHVWLYEMGFTYQGSGLCFNAEDVCEISAFSNDFVNFVTNIYKERQV